MPAPSRTTKKKMPNTNTMALAPHRRINVSSTASPATAQRARLGKRRPPTPGTARPSVTGVCDVSSLATSSRASSMFPLARLLRQRHVAAGLHDGLAGVREDPVQVLPHLGGGLARRVHEH